VRMALGASSRRVLTEMMRESAGRIVIGIGIGIVGFLATGRLASSLLYNTSYADVRVMIGAIMLLSAASMTVVYTQARRLATVSPALALREDSSSN
jgi:putative ABC transport system permease protein